MRTFVGWLGFLAIFIAFAVRLPWTLAGLVLLGLVVFVFAPAPSR